MLNRGVLATLLTVALTWPAEARPQDEAAPLAIDDLTGVWEGLDDAGADLFWTIEPADEGADAVTITFTRTDEGVRSDRQITYGVRSTAAGVAHLVGVAREAGDVLLARRVVDDGLRVTWPDGRYALLLRLADAPPETARLFVAAAGFTDAVQAGLLRLDGRWVDASGEAVLLRVVDTARGLLSWQRDATAEPIELRLERFDGSSWRLRDAEDTPWVLSIDPSGLSASSEGAEPMRLQRSP